MCHYVLVHMHELKAYGSWFVYVCNSDFSKVAKTKHWQVWYRHSMTILNEAGASFTIIWRDLLTSNTVVAHSRLPRSQIYSQQIMSLQLETWINKIGTAADSRTTQ